MLFRREKILRRWKKQWSWCRWMAWGGSTLADSLRIHHTWMRWVEVEYERSTLSTWPRPRHGLITTHSSRGFTLRATESSQTRFGIRITRDVHLRLRLLFQGPQILQRLWTDLADATEKWGTKRFIFLARGVGIPWKTSVQRETRLPCKL